MVRRREASETTFRDNRLFFVPDFPLPSGQASSGRSEAAIPRTSFVLDGPTRGTFQEEQIWINRRSLRIWRFALSSRRLPPGRPVSGFTRIIFRLRLVDRSLRIKVINMSHKLRGYPFFLGAGPAVEEASLRGLGDSLKMVIWQELSWLA